MSAFLIVLDGTDEGVSAVNNALTANNGAPVTAFDPYLLIADGDQQTIAAIRELSQGVRAVSSDAALDTSSLNLDADTALVASAWNLQFDPDYQAAKENRSDDFESWGLQGSCIIDESEAVS